MDDRKAGMVHASADQLCQRPGLTRKARCNKGYTQGEVQLQGIQGLFDLAVRCGAGALTKLGSWRALAFGQAVNAIIHHHSAYVQVTGSLGADMLTPDA